MASHAGVNVLYTSNKNTLTKCKRFRVGTCIEKVWKQDVNLGK